MVLRPPKVYDYLPSGRIGLRVSAEFADGCRCVWSDSGTRPLEKSLNSFLAGSIRIAEKIKVNRAERDAWLRKCEEEASQRRERERLRQEEDVRLANLLQGFEQWMRADNLRRYIEAVRSRTIDTHGAVEPLSDIAAWLGWAGRQADAIDPLVGNKSLPSYTVTLEPASRWLGGGVSGLVDRWDWTVPRG
jgi:hypothetical protein